MTKSNEPELGRLEDCYQNLKLLQSDLRKALGGEGDAAKIPGMVEARKKELALLQELDLALEKKMEAMNPEDTQRVKAALLEFGKRFELLAAAEADLLRMLEQQVVRETANHIKKQMPAPPGGKFDVSQ